MPGREAAAFLKGPRLRLAAVQHQGRDAHLREEVADVDLVHRQANTHAFSGDVVLRWRSLNHCICSAVAPGMNRDVKIIRNADFPDPSLRASRSESRRSARFPAASREYAGLALAAEQDQAADAFGMRTAY
jgi:hypothetical protein